VATLTAAAAITGYTGRPAHAADVFLDGGTFTVNDATHADDTLFVGLSSPTTLNIVTGADVYIVAAYGTSLLNATGGVTDTVFVNNDSTLSVGGTALVSSSWVYENGAVNITGGTAEFVNLSATTTSLVATGGALLDVYGRGAITIGGTTTVGRAWSFGDYTQTGGAVTELLAWSGNAVISGGTLATAAAYGSATNPDNTPYLPGTGSITFLGANLTVSGGTTPYGIVQNGHQYIAADYQLSGTYDGGGAANTTVSAAAGGVTAAAGGGFVFAPFTANLAPSLDLLTDSTVTGGIYDFVTVGVSGGPSSNTVQLDATETYTLRTYGSSTVNAADSVELDNVEIFDSSAVNVRGGFVNFADVYGTGRYTQEGGEVYGIYADDNASVAVTGGANTYVDNIDLYGNATASLDATIEDAYLNDDSVLTIDGGTVDYLVAFDNGLSILNDGEIAYEAAFYDYSRFHMKGGSAAYVGLYAEGAAVRVDGGTIEEMESFFGSNSVEQTGGTIESLTLYDDAVFTLSGGVTNTVYGYDESFTYLTGTGHLDDIYLYDNASFLMDGGTLSGNTLYLLGDGTATFDFVNGAYDTLTSEQTGTFTIGGVEFTGTWYQLTGRLTGGGTVSTRYFLAASDASGATFGPTVRFAATDAPEPSALALLALPLAGMVIRRIQRKA
jgi:hypothetical protein